jgi:hypothetical protein
MVFNKELKIITSASNSVIQKKPTAMAKTSNRQETFNDKADDQKNCEQKKQDKLSRPLPHTNTKNMDIGTAKKQKRRTVGK